MSTVLPIEPFVIFAIIGFVFFVYFIIKNSFETLIRRTGIIYKKKTTGTPYDNFSKEEIKDIVTRMNANYRVIITIYGVLLAFVISDRVGLVLINWNFLIWTSWLLAIIVRAGMISMSLFDLVETNSLDKAKKHLYASKIFFKNSLFLLLLGIALIPTFFTAETPDDIKEILTKYPWHSEMSLFTTALAIFSVFLFFYYVPFKISNYVTKEGTQNLWVFGIFVLIFSFFIGSNFGPHLEAKEVVLFGFNAVIPLFYLYLLLSADLASLWMILMTFTHKQQSPNETLKK